MTGSQSLAELSNASVYSAMFALLIAMFAFAVSFSQRRPVTVDVRQNKRVEVMAGGSATRSPDAPSKAVPQPLAPGDRAGNIALAVSWLGFGLLTVSVVSRGLWAERVPWGNMYEFSLTSALAVLGVFLGISTRRDVRWLGVFVVPLVLLALGMAVTVLYTEAAQLVPALQSYWLIIHVACMVLCGGAFTVAGVMAALYLVAESGSSDRGTVGSRLCGPVARRLPEALKLDRMSYRTIAFTFPVYTFAVVAGAIWAESAWGRYWGWDPKETWAFIAWVIYAGYLHARSTVGWRGRKAAWLAVVGVVIFWFNYFGVNLLFSGLHSYSGV